MVIVFPVAGKGKRFYSKSTTLPKCLIPVRERPMIEWALDTVFHKENDVVVIYHRDQLPLIKSTLKGLMPKATLIEQKTPLRGAADTVYQAKKYFKNKKDIVCVDCDIYAHSPCQNKGWEKFNGDGSVLTFKSQHPSKSYVQLEGDNVAKVVEKKVISNQAIGGIYHFRSGNGLIEALKQQFKTNLKTKGEFYLSGTMQIYLKNHPRVITLKAKKFFDLGTPKKIKEFEKLPKKVIYG